MAEPTDDEPPHKTTTTAATTTAAWGTLEELLLVSAVNRYGTTSWDSVARELHKRFSSSSSSNNNNSVSLFTPHICQQKYRDLKRRFSAVARRNSGQTAAADGNTTSFWLDELRRLRVAELRRELERYDVSIVSLQSKVNRLKEERENPDLQKIEEPPETVAVAVTGGRRNESMNESNSTDRKKEPVDEPDTKPDPPETAEPGRAREPVEEDAEEDSCELVESVSESKGSGGGGGGEAAKEKEKEKESSDVQSAASFSSKEKKRREKNWWL